jgi:hypothetical protein
MRTTNERMDSSNNRIICEKEKDPDTIIVQDLVYSIDDIIKQLTVEHQTVLDPLMDRRDCLHC